MIWTDEAVEELKKMWDRGMTTGQIAKALNVTKNSIIGKVHRLCLTARPSPIKKPASKEDKKASHEDKQSGRAKGKATSKDKQETVKGLNHATPAPEQRNIPLVKLDNHSCRWPMGDPRDEDFCFCGKRVKTGQTYCEEHANIAYVRAGRKF